MAILYQKLLSNNPAQKRDNTLLSIGHFKALICPNIQQ